MYVYTRLLSTRPVVEILTGSVDIRVTYNTLSRYTEPWFSKIQEGMEQRLICFSASFASVSWCQEKFAKKTLKLVSPSWNFWGPGFWIQTKGVMSYLNSDWPCQDFTQGSTTEQPSVYCKWALPKKKLSKQI